MIILSFGNTVRGWGECSGVSNGRRKAMYLREIVKRMICGERCGREGGEGRATLFEAAPARMQEREGGAVQYSGERTRRKE